MAVKLSTKTNTSSWTSVFPTETIQSQAQSLKFMRKFAAVGKPVNSSFNHNRSGNLHFYQLLGISNILYLRSELPDDTFSTISIDGFRVTMLKNSENPVASQICTTTANAVKALKDGYLKELQMVFYPDAGSEEVIESYKFSFELPKDRMSSTLDSDGDGTVSHELLKKSTLQLLRSMSTYMQTSKALPASAQMNFRIFYTDDVPKDYNPPGFISLSPKSYGTKFLETPPTPVNFGSIATKWHKVDVTMQ